MCFSFRKTTLGFISGYYTLIRCHTGSFDNEIWNQVTVHLWSIGLRFNCGIWNLNLESYLMLSMSVCNLHHELSEKATRFVSCEKTVFINNECDSYSAEYFLKVVIKWLCNICKGDSFITENCFKTSYFSEFCVFKFGNDGRILNLRISIFFQKMNCLFDVF